MCFDSDSASSSTTQNYDKRLAVDHGLGVTGDGNTITTSSTLSDSGAIAAALEMNKGSTALSSHSVDMAQNSAMFMGIVADAAGKRELEAMQSALDATTRANSDALAGMQKATSDAVGAVGTATKNALDFSGQTLKDAFAFSSKNMADVLGLESHIVDKAFDQNKAVQDAFATATNDVNRAWDSSSQFQVDKVTADSKYMIYAFVGLIAVMALGKK